MIILNRIKEIRKELKLTQRDLEDRCQLAHSTVSDLERGITHPNHITMLLLCKGLGREFNEVFETDPSVLDSYFGRNFDHTQK